VGNDADVAEVSVVRVHGGSFVVKPQFRASSMAWSAMAGRQARIRLTASVEGEVRSRSAGARRSRSGERESWQSACRRCAWQESETKTRNPGKLALAGVLVRKAQAFRSRRKAWSGGDARLGHAGRDVHSFVLSQVTRKRARGALSRFVGKFPLQKSRHSNSIL
jgi:hypothetical protein